MYNERSAADLYTQAETEYSKKDYVAAARTYDEIDRQHPGSEEAIDAQLKSAYAYYRGGKYNEALSQLETFMQLHPVHKELHYAMYLKGLVHYTQIPVVEKDQSSTRDALQSFGELITRFPNSSYVKDARLKIDLTQDHLAGREMTIGRFYSSKRMFIPAIARFQTVIHEYQKTNHVPEALHRLVEAYYAMGLTEEAQAVAAVLGHNFPGSRWYEDSYAVLKKGHLDPDYVRGSWLDKGLSYLRF